MLSSIHSTSVGHGYEFAIFSGQRGLSPSLHQFFMAKPVGNQIDYGYYLQVKFGSHSFELRHTGHRAIFIHNFTYDASRIKPGQPGQINHSFAVPRSYQHPTLLGSNRKYVPWLSYVTRFGITIKHRSYCLCSIKSRDPGSNLLLRFNGNRKGSGVARRVLSDHQWYS